MTSFSDVTDLIIDFENLEAEIGAFGGRTQDGVTKLLNQISQDRKIVVTQDILEKLRALVTMRRAT